MIVHGDVRSSYGRRRLQRRGYLDLGGVVDIFRFDCRPGFIRTEAEFLRFGAFFVPAGVALAFLLLDSIGLCVIRDGGGRCGLWEWWIGQRGQ